GKQRMVKDLLKEELIPIARKGLENCHISTSDINNYLGIIEKRLETWNGAEWTVKSYRNQQIHKKPMEALQVLTSFIYENQQKDLPVGEWDILKADHTTNFEIQRIVKHNMNTNIYSVDANDSLEIVINMMIWNKIHHMPVIDANKKIIGLLSWNDIAKFNDNGDSTVLCVNDVMKTDIITTDQDLPLIDAVELMKKNKIGCLPVINRNKLIGILTRNDLVL
ncbi:MAG: CBS domain-containing protein, partial [Gramella sp.]|nr:CBS domain-containing protein [Christiangramia sp.]